MNSGDARAARRARRSMARRAEESHPQNPQDVIDVSDTSIDTGGPSSRKPGAQQQEQKQQDAEPQKREQNQQRQDLAATSPKEGGAEEEDGKEEDIDDDDLCPICQLLLHNPVTTTCSHTLCSFCMATWASVSLESPNAITIVDVDEEPVDFDAVEDLEAKCPMCRTLTAARPNAGRLSELKVKYPELYAEREKEVLREQSAGGEDGDGGIQTITVYIGNRHQRVPPSPNGLEQNQHEWDFFVRPSRTDIIEEVHMHLHPTFKPRTVVRSRAPYQISRLGWGVFEVTADVVLKAGYSWVSEQARETTDGARKGLLPLEWMLDFDGFGGKGSMARCRLKVRKEGGGVEDGELGRDLREMGRMRRQYDRDGRYEPSSGRRERRRRRQ